MQKQVRKRVASYDTLPDSDLIPVMTSAISPNQDVAITASADNLLVRYNLRVCDYSQSPTTRPITSPQDAADSEAGRATQPERTAVHRTKYPGNGAIAIHPNGKVFAVAGWDGKYVRVNFRVHRWY